MILDLIRRFMNHFMVVNPSLISSFDVPAVQRDITCLLAGTPKNF